MNIYHRLDYLITKDDENTNIEEQENKNRKKEKEDIPLSISEINAYLNNPTVDDYAKLIGRKVFKSKNFKRIKPKKKEKCLFLQKPYNYYYSIIGYNNSDKTKNSYYYCEICNHIFANVDDHYIQMNGKCPQIKNGRSISVNTILYEEYPITHNFDSDTLTENVTVSDQPNTAAFASNVIYGNCPICLELKRVAYVYISCGHCICLDCLLDLLNNNIKKQIYNKNQDIMTTLKCSSCRSLPQKNRVMLSA